jgi:hypothetical protein
MLSGNVKGSPPYLKKEKLRMYSGKATDEIYDIPDGISVHLTRECRGNVHGHHAVDVTCGSFEKETHGVIYAAKNSADLETNSHFHSAYHLYWDDITSARDNWICYDFKERRIVLTHHSIRANRGPPGVDQLKSWLIGTSADREHRGQQTAQQLFVYWHISRCGRRGVPLHPARELPTSRGDLISGPTMGAHILFLCPADRSCSHSSAKYRTQGGLPSDVVACGICSRVPLF